MKSPITAYILCILFYAAVASAYAYGSYGMGGMGGYGMGGVSMGMPTIGMDMGMGMGMGMGKGGYGQSMPPIVIQAPAQQPSYPMPMFGKGGHEKKRRGGGMDNLRKYSLTFSNQCFYICLTV